MQHFAQVYSFSSASLAPAKFGHLRAPSVSAWLRNCLLPIPASHAFVAFSIHTYALLLYPFVGDYCPEKENIPAAAHWAGAHLHTCHPSMDLLWGAH